MIRKQGNAYHVLSESGKSLGSYGTEKEAKRRLQQIEMFRHMREQGPPAYKPGPKREHHE